MPAFYDELKGDSKFVLKYQRYTKRGYFLTRGCDVKLNDTFLDSEVRIYCFVCCTVDIFDF